MATTQSTAQPAPSCSDHELVAEVRRGSDRAFEELYSRYRGRIGIYIHGMVGDHGRSEDVAQEVFISALRRMRDTERPIVFKPWIYEIAKNACVDEFRRSRRIREVPFQLDAEPQIRISTAACTSTTPEVAVESKQQLDDLRGAFGGLSESHHRILVLRELEGLSYKEIGSRMSISKPTVESTLFRARQRLTEEYGELVSGRRCRQIQSLIAADGSRPLHQLGVRARRQLARHLAHCQACRRQARLAGLGEQYFHAPARSKKLAGLWPFPWLAWRPWRRGGQGSASTTGSTSTLTQIQAVAQSVVPVLSSAGLGRAAAATAAIVIGGGSVATVVSHSAHSSAGMQRATNVTAGTSTAPISAAPLRGPGALPGRGSHQATQASSLSHHVRPSASHGNGQSSGPPPTQSASSGNHGNPLAPVLRLVPSVSSNGSAITVTGPLVSNGQQGGSYQQPSLPVPQLVIPLQNHSNGSHPLRRHLRSMFGEAPPRTGFDNHGDVPSSGSG